MNEYELFEMTDDKNVETTDDKNVETMFSKFSKTVSELKTLGMVYSNALYVRKLIRRAPKAGKTNKLLIKFRKYIIKKNKLLFDYKFWIRFS